MAVRFSLLLATVHRTEEVKHFLEHLARQTRRDLELIVIDQNRDDRLDEVLKPYRRLFEIRRLPCARGHSRALNLGLAQARGDIVAFPDDDCWYDPGTLARVADFFEAHPESSGLTGREIVEPEFKLGSRWDKRGGRVTRRNVWRRAITFTIFLRRSAAADFEFDETLGVGAGSPWGAGEETEYLLRLIDQGRRIDYEPSLTIWHQGRSGPYTPEVYAKAYDYAMGIGRVLRMARFPLHLAMYHLARPLGGAMLALARGRTEQSAYHWAIFRGRSRGWASPPVSRPVSPRPAGARGAVSGREVELR